MDCVFVVIIYLSLFKPSLPRILSLCADEGR